MIWKVPPSLPEVEVSSQGDVRCKIAPPNNRWGTGRGGIAEGHIYKLVVRSSTEPYLVVRIQRDGKKVRRSVHALVCEAFHGPRPSPRHLAAHINGDTFCNVRSNLYWATPQQNMDDRERHGRTPRGEASGTSKLTDADVRSIRKRRRAGEGLTSIAIDFGVTKATICSVALFKSWKHIL